MNTKTFLWVLGAIALIWLMAKRGQAQQAQGDPIKQGSLFGGTSTWLPWQATPLDDKADIFSATTSEYNALLKSAGAGYFSTATASGANRKSLLGD